MKNFKDTLSGVQDATYRKVDDSTPETGTQQFTSVTPFDEEDEYPAHKNDPDRKDDSQS